MQRQTLITGVGLYKPNTNHNRRGRPNGGLPKEVQVRRNQRSTGLVRIFAEEVRARVRFERNAQVAGIVANWSQGATAQRAADLGLVPDADFQTIIRQYIADCESAGLGASALKGFRR